MKIALMLWILLLSLGVQANGLLCQDLFATPTAVEDRALAPDQEGHREFLPRLSNTRTPLSESDVFAKNEFARNFVRFAERGMLLHQADPQLGERGLLTPFGGLCASTCMANSVFSMTVVASRAREVHDVYYDFMQMVIHRYNRETHSDARNGAFVNLMADVIHKLLKKSQVISMAKAHEIDVFHMLAKENRIAEFLNRNSLVIGTVRTLRYFEENIHSSHAIVILAIDRQNQVIYFSDPNNPNVIAKERYVVNPMKELIFKVPDTYGYHNVKLVSASGFYEIPY